MSCFLLQVAGEGGAVTAATLTTRLVEHDMHKIRDLVGLQLHDLDSSQGGIDPIYWDEEARLHRFITKCICVIILKFSRCWRWRAKPLRRPLREEEFARGNHLCQRLGHRRRNSGRCMIPEPCRPSMFRMLLLQVRPRNED